MKFVNCTPHDIVLNNGRVFGPSGNLPRVKAEFSKFDADGICSQSFGEVDGLPEETAGTTFVVSAMVLAAVKGLREDCIAPATGHADTVRNEKGHIVSVPGFVGN